MEPIIKNVRSVIGEEDIKTKIEEKRGLSAYWGTEPTECPTIDYLVPLMKIRDLIKSNVSMTILIADVHAFLKKGPSEFDLTHERSLFYKFIISELLEYLGVSPTKYTFQQGSEVQLDKRYVIDLYKFMSMVTVKQSAKAGSGIMHYGRDPNLSNIVYPLMQVLDETVLEVDIQIGDISQREIFVMSRDYVNKLGYNKCSYLIHNYIPYLSKPTKYIRPAGELDRISFVDDKKTIALKIKKAFCVEKNINLDRSPCLAMCKHIVYPMGKNIGDYKSYESLENDWILGVLGAKKLKTLLTTALNEIIAPIRQKISENEDLYQNAYR